MRSMMIVLLAGVLLAGCAGPMIQKAVGLVGPDLDGAAAVLKGSVDLLPPDDPWLRCVASAQAINGYLLAGPGLQVANGGLLTEAARLHVLDSLSQNLPPALKAACGELAIQLLLRAGSRLPGL